MDKFGSFLLGLGLGVGVGLVFAPRSGEETRDLLKAKAEMQSVPAEQCSVRGLRGGGLPVRSISLSSRSGYKDI